MTAVVLCDAAAPQQVFAALSEALNNNGPAVLVRDARASRMVAAGETPLTEAPDGTALLIQTSGTSGKPKTVALSAAALRASALSAHERLGGPGQWLLALPLTYIAGMSVLVRSNESGTEPVFMPSGPFDARTFLQSVSEMTGTRRYTALVPVQLARVLEEAEDNTEALESLRTLDAVLIGGQALEPDLRERAQALGVKIVTTYGSSETSGGCVYDGVPLLGVNVEIAEDSGEILVSAPQLATEYVGDNQRTSDTFQNRNGVVWYHTGDAGTLENGVLTVLGRLDRVITSGGLKIDLDAVEKVVRGISDCSQALVIHIPDSEWGVRPAVVVPGVDEDAELSAQIYDEIVAELGRVAAPKVVCFIDEIPRLSSGKPDLLTLSAYAASQK
ncbi:O-succinylbenzoic acid--CoA ligase [Aurantimicrobium minutum]|uniref:AMP-binding protein n=1 Tax=Aurantimicrobium minutum TaxID=708131 RepID=UPI0024732C19|nr:AMP-binding protein [Aurantimicrobium minutum]MDH6409767.1 O-succinylbenzoic acid--CoA ligase [Aurantimicrobium minutum]MDH6423974.1 O-succinylbenzoic acid--CoA ligase [Aurantimicrobium minutum]